MTHPEDAGVGLQAWPVRGIGEVSEGSDLPSLLDSVDLLVGDVVLVTSKIVSKAEGRVATGDREAAVEAETTHVVARRGPTRIVQNPQGLVLAAAGVDASNVEQGQLLLLPVDPDASARALRSRLLARRGVNVAVVVTDTAGRPWRNGQVDIAIGVAGLQPLLDLSGEVDAYGNVLQVSAPAVADELAGLAELVTGKLSGQPVAVVRGLAGMVLAPDDHGPGARALQRPLDQDMFALGAREAVVAAVAGRSRDRYGAPATADEVLVALAECGLAASTVGVSVRVQLPPGDVVRQAVAAERARLIAHGHGWLPHSDVRDEAADDNLTLSPGVTT